MWKDVPYVILSILIALVLLSLHFPVQGAELVSGAGATSRVEFGYTSNGTDSGIGEPDLFIHHVETLEIASEAGATALRGSLWVEETRFREQDIENDQALGLSFALGQQLSPELVLRGSVSMLAANTGDDWNLAGFYIATRTPSLSADAMVEAILTLQGTELRGKVSLGGHRYGAASFPGLPLDPFKLQADDTRYGFEVRLRQSIGPVIGLAALEGEAVEISQGDQQQLGRLPGSKLRGSLGVEIKIGGATLTGEGGGVLAWADGQQLVRPYGKLRVAAALTDALSVEAAAGTHLELVDNLDAAGSFDRRLALAVAYALAPGLSVTASAERTDRVGLLDSAVTSGESVFGLGLEHELSGQLSYNVRVSRTLHEDFAERYRKDEFVLGVTGSI